MKIKNLFFSKFLIRVFIGAISFTGLPVTSFSSEPVRMTPIQEIFEPNPPLELSKFVKVAVIQWAPPASTPVGVSAEQAEFIKDRNRSTLERMIREAASRGAEWVVTPEFAVVGYPDIPELPPEEDEFRNRDDIAPYVEQENGPTFQHFSNLARQLKIYLHVGFAEVDPRTNLYYNSVIAIGPDGKLKAKYRKKSLFKIEKDFLAPGNEIATYTGPFGTAGIVICADIYSSSTLHAYRRLGTDVLALSTSWTQMNTGMSFFQGGANTAHAFVLAANQPYFPDSGVINPNGTIQSHIRQTIGIAYGYVPRKSPNR